MAAAAKPTHIQNEGEIMLLSGWTPVTTRLLQQKSNAAWNYFDEPRETFAHDLLAELVESKVFDRLQPAKTTSESNSTTMIHQILSSQGLVEETSNHQRGGVRGDKSLFLAREFRKTPHFRTQCPCLAMWIQSVEATAVHKLSSTMEFDLAQTSVQIAEYPGDGTSGYPVHMDESSTQREAKRLLTVLYYLTPHGWSSEHDGGCLRVWGDDMYTDIPPYAGRTIIFRSDSVRHSVLPSLRRPRRAITIWLYGRVINHGKSAPQKPTVLPCTDVAVSPCPRIALAQQQQGPPPLEHIEGKDDSSSTIFVSIAAHRDSETGPTLRDLFATALFPDRISVGLVLQIDTAPNSTDRVTILGSLPHGEPWWQEQVRMLQLDARFSTGPCNARAMAQTLYRNEDYVLQIDSHMRFRKNWDVYMIQQLHKCPNPKGSMLTAYPVGYKLPHDVPNETRGTLLLPWKFGAEGMLRIKGRLFREAMPLGRDGKPIVCHLYAAGFNFAMGIPVSYDGTLHHLFFGEETSMALRLFMAGYDTYAPSQSVVYHLWTRTHRLESLAPPNEEANQRSLGIVRQQLQGRIRPMHECERSAEEFARVIGVDFAALRVNLYDDEAEQMRLENLLGGDVSTIPNNGSTTKLLNDRANDLISSFLG